MKRTLHSWDYRLLDTPKDIECPVMEVIGHDHEAPLLKGPGHISIKSPTSMQFVMHAEVCDEGRAFQALMQAKANPYENLEQLRVFATDYDGTRWNCGWVNVQMGDITESRWRLSGEIQGIITTVSGHGVSQKAGVEVIYDSRLQFPYPMPRKRGDPGLGKDETPHTVTVEGVKLEFFISPNESRTLGVANVCSGFNHPFAENWISEPLNILLGQLIYPRLVARNMGNGTAQVSLRVVPEHVANHKISSILSEPAWADQKRFWELFGAIFSVVIHARDESGNPNFELNSLTHYYQELAQATTGSNWVLCMTLASVIEGVANLMFPIKDRASDIDVKKIESLKAHIEEWKEDMHLRQRMLDSLARTKTNGVVQSLRGLCRRGILDNSHLQTWQTVRNQVMHGRLVSPWSTQELELQLKNLIQLVHRLSEAYIRRPLSGQ
ncbi:MAG: hypothetical protein ACOH2R_24310 [Pseudomonas sp.]